MKQNDRKLALDHAWAWFSLHSGQRLQAVNFFLVAVAFLSAAYVTAAKENLHAVAIGVSALSIIISFLFYRVERRIRSLIHASEDAMKPLQSHFSESLGIEALKLSERVEELKTGDWKYSKVFRYLYLSTSAAFALALLYSIWRKFSSTPSAQAFNLALEALVSAFLLVFGYELLIERPKMSSGDPVTTTLRWVLLVLGAVCVVAGIGVTVHLVFTRL